MARKTRIRKKRCAKCEKTNGVMYRVTTYSFKTWQFVCPECQVGISNKVGYQYGGTWKAKKRN